MAKLKNPETIVQHGGDYRSDPATTAVAVPIYRTTSYQFKSTETAVRRLAKSEGLHSHAESIRIRSE